MDQLTRYATRIEEALANLSYPQTPELLYAPIRYILSLGGKRVRPLLALMACDLFTEDGLRAMPVAIGIELFHNFTLLHDDVMDRSPLRRGKPTAHMLWGENGAILSGDVMQILAYEQLLSLPASYRDAVQQLFFKTAREVHEGQQYDMQFESISSVSVVDYMEMIRLKTAVLLGGALGMGALCGGASRNDVAALYDFGEALGIAFQLQDDWLDVYGDETVFGKPIGGDIRNNKKTYLLLTAQAMASPQQKMRLDKWFVDAPNGSAEKVADVTGLYTETGAEAACRQQIELYFQKALAALNRVSVSDSERTPLRAMALRLLNRKS